MKRLLVLIALLLLIPLAVSAQDAPPEVEVALADFNQRVGANVTLDQLANWTWEEQIFNDASLGCPQPEQMYAQVVTRGYIFTFTYQGEIYDYRSMSGSNQAALCSITPIAEETAEAGGDVLLPTEETAPVATIEPTTVPVTEATPAPEATDVSGAVSPADFQQLAQVEGEFNPYLAWSPTGNTIAVSAVVPAGDAATTGRVAFYNPDDLTAQPETVDLNEPVTSLDYLINAGFAYMVVGDAVGTVGLFPVEPVGLDILTMQTAENNLTSTVNDVAVSADLSLVATTHAVSDEAGMESQWSGTVWNANTGEFIATLQTAAPAIAVAFSPDGSLLALGDLDGAVTLWDSVTNEQLASFEGHTGAVRALEFSPDGSLLASGSDDGSVRVWNVSGMPEEFSELAILDSGAGAPVLTVSFSPDGSLLATAGGAEDSAGTDSPIALWDVSALSGAGEQIAPAAVLSGHTDRVGSVDFSPDGTQLASVSLDGTVRVWGVEEEVVG